MFEGAAFADCEQHDRHDRTRPPLAISWFRRGRFPFDHGSRRRIGLLGDGQLAEAFDRGRLAMARGQNGTELRHVLGKRRVERGVRVFARHLSAATKRRGPRLDVRSRSPRLAVPWLERPPSWVSLIVAVTTGLLSLLRSQGNIATKARRGPLAPLLSARLAQGDRRSTGRVRRDGP
jgi:hypothetical protein